MRTLMVWLNGIVNSRIDFAIAKLFESFAWRWRPVLFLERGKYGVQGVFIGYAIQALQQNGYQIVVAIAIFRF